VSKKQKIIAFDKKGFEGVQVGVLELSSAQIEDIVRCCWAHATQRFGNENPMFPPTLFWHDGFLICTCMAHTILDKTALTLHFPFVCYSRMLDYKETLLIPNLRPEAYVPIIKIVPRLLRDIFTDIIAKDIQEEAEKSDA